MEKDMKKIEESLTKSFSSFMKEHVSKNYKQIELDFI